MVRILSFTEERNILVAVTSPTNEVAALTHGIGKPRPAFTARVLESPCNNRSAEPLLEHVRILVTHHVANLGSAQILICDALICNS